MNILPLIISSLLILACVSTVFFRERQSTIWEERSYLGYMNAERKARAKIASSHYSKAKSKKDAENTHQESKAAEETSFVNRRERKQLTELSKLNITPLFSEKSSELYEIAARLIKDLYEKAPFYKEDLERAILDSMIAVAQNNKHAVQIHEFFPENPQLRTAFYKMAKGTHGNYPSLGEYIAIDRNLERKPINFSFASLPLLHAVFGEETTQAIVKEERKKWEKDNKQHRLSEQELETLLLSARKKPVDYQKVKAFFDFERKAVPKKQITAVDKETQIIITKEL